MFLSLRTDLQRVDDPVPPTGLPDPMARATCPATRDHGPWRAGRATATLIAMWTHRAVVSSLLAVAGLAGLVGAAADGYAAALAASGEVLTTSERMPLALALGATLVGLGWALAGALLAWLRPGNLVGWVLLVVGTLAQLSVSEESVAAAGWWGPAAADGDWTARPVGLVLTLVGGWSIMTMLGVLPAIYPDGRRPSGHWRWPMLAVAAGALLFQVQWALSQPTLTGGVDPAASGAEAAAENAGLIRLVPVTVFLVGAVALWALAAASMFRSPAPRRQQLGWLLGSVVVILVANSLGDSLSLQVAQIASLYLLPLSIALALLRYRLLGIDASPRADPLRSVAEIGSHVTSGDDPELLGAVLASVRRSVDAPGALVRDAGGQVLSASGDPGRPGLICDLAVGGVPVGQLEVSHRWSGDRFTPRDERLLRTLAAQVAAVIHTQRLGEELEAQRDAARAARTHERERLRRELHDGLGPALTGIGLGLSGLEDAVRSDHVERAQEIAAVLRQEVGGTVTEVRRIIDDLHPASLEENGFAEAIRQRVTSVAANLPVSVRIGHLLELPPQVEQAAYRVVGEAVANAARHANPTAIAVCIDCDETGQLVIEVRDDGSGFDTAASTADGIGLPSMRARARELGGLLTIESSTAGTTVLCHVPIGIPVA